MRKRFVLAGAVLAAALIGTTVGADASTKVTVGNWCQSHSEIGILGDSISSGWTLDPGNPYTNEPTNPNIWFQDIAQQMGSAADNQSLAGAGSNNFVPGGSLYANTQEFGTSQPNMVFVFVGTNDWLGNVPPGMYQANMVTIYNTIHNESASSSIVFIGTYDTSTYHATTYSWSSYLIAETNAAVATGAGLVLMSQVVPPDGSTNPSATGLYNGDNTHLTTAGQRVMGAYALGRVLTICG